MIENLSYPKPPGRARILELNLWQRYGKWNDRRSLLVNGISRFQPDVVGFVESIKTDAYDQVADLLGPEFIVAHSSVRDPNGMGISIASRWPLKDPQEVNLRLSPRTSGFPCTTLVAEIMSPEPIGPFLFANHFPNWQLNFEYERELQAVEAALFIEERTKGGTKQVVMVGDLDADPNAASIRFWTGRQSLNGVSVCYRDAWESTHPTDPGHTFTPENPLVRKGVIEGMRPFRDWPFRRIDYIFVRYGEHGGNVLDILACERAFAVPVDGVWASDHFGLVVELGKASS